MISAGLTVRAGWRLSYPRKRLSVDSLFFFWFTRGNTAVEQRGDVVKDIEDLKRSLLGNQIELIKNGRFRIPTLLSGDWEIEVEEGRLIGGFVFFGRDGLVSIQNITTDGKLMKIHLSNEGYFLYESIEGRLTMKAFNTKAETVKFFHVIDDPSPFEEVIKKIKGREFHGISGNKVIHLHDFLIDIVYGEIHLMPKRDRKPFSGLERVIDAEFADKRFVLSTESFDIFVEKDPKGYLELEFSNDSTFEWLLDDTTWKCR